MLVQIIYILIGIILHPIKIHKAVEHVEITKHELNMEVLNFNYDVWCDDCGEVFLDEIR